MNRISDEKIIEAINTVAEAGHPDPLGFLARAEIKTGLQFDGQYKDAIGTFGVDKRQALSLGYSEDDLMTTDGNLMAAFDVDMANFRKANQDLHEMYRLSNAGGSQSTDRFLSKLLDKRQEFTDQLYFQDGKLSALTKPKETNPVDGKVIQQKTSNDPSATDISSEASSFGFQAKHKEDIDKLMNQLIYNIIDEKPANAIR